MSEDVLDQVRRRRHGDTVVETAIVVCKSCDDYEMGVTYRGDPDAGSIGQAISDDYDLDECPVCGGETKTVVE